MKRQLLLRVLPVHVGRLLQDCAGVWGMRYSPLEMQGSAALERRARWRATRWRLEQHETLWVLQPWLLQRWVISKLHIEPLGLWSVTC